eukprot:TRINITY_DN14128_c0_g1_i1.p1 TRINITY_DN14128_c0_g1~~TRINITY_DN14128_c0_g1_i1.p1  ORF type:complete len:627 (-),score=117.80 TRINITY_DN14128_c0_g1_i1:149-2029(-)
MLSLDQVHQVLPGTPDDVALRAPGNVNAVKRNGSKDGGITGTSSPAIHVDDIFADLQDQLQGLIERQARELEDKVKASMRESCARLKLELGGYSSASTAPGRQDFRNLSHSQSHSSQRPEETALEDWVEYSAPGEMKKTFSSTRAYRKDEVIKLPTAKLQIASLNKLAEHGKTVAQRAALSAGYFGGNTTFIQVFCFIIGFSLAVLMPMRLEEKLFGIPDSRFLELGANSIYMTAQVPAGLCWMGRAYFLRTGKTVLAHSLFVLAFLVYGAIRPFECCLQIVMTVYYGDCSGYQPGFLFEAAGENCKYVHIAGEVVTLMLCLGCLWTAHSLHFIRRTAAQTSFCFTLCFASISMGYVFFFKVLFNIFTSWDLSDLVVICGLVLVAAYVFKQRQWHLENATRLVWDDISTYGDIWKGLSKVNGEALKSLADAVTVKQEAAKAALLEGESVMHRLESTLALQPRQLLTDLPLLYAQAYEINDHFQEKCSEWADGLGRHIDVPPKSTTRAIQKMFRSYRGDAGKLLDLVRSSIVCRTLRDVAAVFDRVTKDPTVNIIRIKNRFDPAYNSKDSGGYRSLLLNVIVVDPFTRRTCSDLHICEVEVQVLDIHKARSDGAHQRFEAVRDMLAE